MREVLSGQEDRLLSSPPPQGVPGLRQAIARHLYRFRGVRARPEQIVVGAGSETLIAFLVQLLGFLPPEPDGLSLVLAGLLCAVACVLLAVLTWPLYAFGQITSDVHAIKESGGQPGDASAGAGSQPVREAAARTLKNAKLCAVSYGTVTAVSPISRQCSSSASQRAVATPRPWQSHRTNRWSR